MSRSAGRALDAFAVAQLSAITDSLCVAYPSAPASALLADTRRLLRFVVGRLDDVATEPIRAARAAAGWLSLLAGCLENDLGDQAAAERSRLAAASFGETAGAGEIEAWAHELTAWFALTSGRFDDVLVAVRAGTRCSPRGHAAVQLAGQEAKAWARLGEPPRVEAALERGRRLVEALPPPPPPDPRHHFVVDRARLDFLSMDAYRVVGDDVRAEKLARQVLGRDLTSAWGTLTPMRAAEAHVTLGVVAARRGDAAAAVRHGRHALEAERRSAPSLAMVERELAGVLRERYPGVAEARVFVAEVAALTSVTSRTHGRP